MIQWPQFILLATNPILIHHSGCARDQSLPNPAHNSRSPATGTTFSEAYILAPRPPINITASLQVAAQLNPDTDAELGLPDMVGYYHSIYPLEDVAAADESVSAAFGVRTLLLKGVLTADGQPYTLRRMDPRQVRSCNVTVVLEWLHSHCHPIMIWVSKYDSSAPS